jgi:hypothetical protein
MFHANEVAFILSAITAAGGWAILHAGCVYRQGIYCSKLILTGKLLFPDQVIGYCFPAIHASPPAGLVIVIGPWLVTALTTRVKELVTDLPCASTTLRVNGKFPAEVIVPPIYPSSFGAIHGATMQLNAGNVRLTPEGRPSAVQEYGAVPPDTVKRLENF